MMKEIDIYDFDKTIVPFDSGSLFWGYSILHYPWIILLIPFQALLAILMVLKVIDFTKFKKYFFCFVMLIPLDNAVKGFWAEDSFFCCVFGCVFGCFCLYLLRKSK